MVDAIVPDDSTLNRVSRYEAHLGRQLQAALDQLERLQRLRASEDVPAPARLDLAVKGGRGWPGHVFTPCQARTEQANTA